MAVEHVKSPDVFGKIINDITGLRSGPDYTKSRAALYVTAGTVVNAAGASNGSTYQFAELPSTCILDPQTVIDFQGWGYAAVSAGTSDDKDALIASIDVGEETSAFHPIEHGDARWNKPLWQALGMEKDPGGSIALFFHTAAGATGAGAISFDIYWRYN